MEVREASAGYSVAADQRGLTGYKQTEVGLIPEDWMVSKLAAVCSMKSGEGITSANIDEYSEYPCYGGNGLRGFTMRFTHDGRYALIGRQGALCGNVLGVEGKLFASEHAIVVTASPRTDIRWLTFVLGKMRLNQYSESSAQPGLSVSKILSLNVAYPPTKAEQEAIAEALSDADALIESLSLLLAKKRHLKQGAMQELLTGKKRLPGFSGEWEVKRLGTTATLNARIGWQGLTTAEYLDSGDYYLVTGTEFKEGYIDWNNCHYVDESRYKQDKNIQLKEHDVLVTKDGTIGKVALITNLPRPATLNSGVFVIRSIEDAFHPEFFYYLLCSNVFNEFLVQLSAGSTINHLYQKDFVNFIYRTPPTIDEQTAIAAILSDMDTEIAALEAKLAKARSIKQGMMQELLTGRIRLV
ncbi:MAG: restriction endonuclease subunit S [Gammaproteobacteria bacterium]|nr:restriction endonuclease subunit S [Gammaproteobacteria bacterium]